MRDQLKGLIPHLREVLKCDFLDGEIYNITDDSEFKPCLTHNYSSIKNTHIPNLLKRNHYFPNNQTELCISIIDILKKDNYFDFESVENIYIVVDSKCYLKMQKPHISNVARKHLVIYLKTEDKYYGITWKYLGRPVYKRLGWRILE
jgi:hypothetical protein